MAQGGSLTGGIWGVRPCAGVSRRGGHPGDTAVGSGDTQGMLLWVQGTLLQVQWQDGTKWNLKASCRSLKELHSFHNFTGDRLG